MKHFIPITLIFTLLCRVAYTQDTFSIVAVDSTTGEVGSAGASCVDLFVYTTYPTIDFLGQLFPGVGAINTQAYYLIKNQENAAKRMKMGDTPSEIIEWLRVNDAGGNSSGRQYGIVKLVNGSPQSAAFTGTDAFNYKNHIVGSNYAIQGNILKGQEVLDSMESKFLKTPGSLACKLMAALQGAKMVGADKRCYGNESSSLFAFLKVAQPNDPEGQPSFLLSVKTRNGAKIEPIDSLQTLFNLENIACKTVAQPEYLENAFPFTVFPNPASDQLTIQSHRTNNYLFQLLDINGRILISKPLSNESQTFDIKNYDRGLYIINISDQEQTYSQKIVFE